jgi:hypothetical protein
LQPELLQQIAEHRPSLKIRRDHWTPFLIASNLTPAAQQLFLQTLRPPQRQPVAKRRLPLVSRPAASPVHGAWTVPPMVAGRTLAFCRSLMQPRMQTALASASPRITLYWERRGLQDEVMEDLVKHELLWPEWVQHDEIDLLELKALSRRL